MCKLFLLVFVLGSTELLLWNCRRAEIVYRIEASLLGADHCMVSSVLVKTVNKLSAGLIPLVDYVTKSVRYSLG